MMLRTDLKEAMFRFSWMIPQFETLVAPASKKKATVPESVLKKTKTQEKLQAAKAAQALILKKERRDKRKVIFKRAEQYTKEYRAKERDEIRLKRIAKKSGSYYVPLRPSLPLLSVSRGNINKLAPKPRKILQLLRLTKINSGTFVRLNKATLQLLQWKSVRELIYKRGFAKVNKQRIPITDNSVVEASLGKYGIICVEDLIHEIFTVGPHFKEPTTSSGPSKTANFIEGGENGNREEHINALIFQDELKWKKIREA
ncbi:ribosomal protein L30, ferredoxin-like fold domain-containing protein [Chytridium lagenaria]|nr:ribosomal protein L30, ferredoxin-like fold domain-containing protein [Chytridium lagenaria]